MTDTILNDAKEIIRGKTKKMRVTIARQQYSGPAGAPRWSSRFYFAKMVNRELARFPLPSDPAKAEKLADEIAAFMELSTSTLAEARRRFNPRALERPSAFSTIGELLDYHKDHWKVLELATGTGEGYHRGLTVVLRQVDAWRRGGDFESWSGMRNEKEKGKLMAPWLERPLTVLTGKLGSDYQRLMVPPDLEDEEEEITQKITCDSNLRSAKSVFSKEAMRLYKQSETLALPDLSDFLGVSLFNAKKYFVLPELPVIRKLFALAPELRLTDLNAYRAFLLCTQAGLRKSEAAHMRMAWLQEEDAPVVRIHADGKFKPKHGHGRKVVLDPWVAMEMRALAADGDCFLDGNETERNEKVFDRLNAWLRKCGVDSRKPTHELRKLWFSQKVKRDGLLKASQQGGHRDPKITSSFYADNQMPENVLPFWQEPTAAALAKMAKSA